MNTINVNKYPRKSCCSNNLELKQQLSLNYKIVDIENNVLNYWKKNKIVEKFINKNSFDTEDIEKDNIFILHDGPPFANGTPHYGHLLTGYLKDIIVRYQSSIGKKVFLKLGWDTHGLPAELEAMKRLNISSTCDIKKIGIEKFNFTCKFFTEKYIKNWEKYLIKQARWVNFRNEYRTSSTNYMESTIWIFKQLYKKKLIYKGYKVLPYCWKDETPLSNHELHMDNVYKKRNTKSAIIGFFIILNKKLKNSIYKSLKNYKKVDIVNIQILIWTTTLWTIPANLAIAVGSDIKYIFILSFKNNKNITKNSIFILSKNALNKYFLQLGYKDINTAKKFIILECTGIELKDLSYIPIFNHFSNNKQKWNTQNAWKIIISNNIDISEGTGIVHQAPAHGEIDQQICDKFDIPTLEIINNRAEFLPFLKKSELKSIVGKNIFCIDDVIIPLIKNKGNIFWQLKHVHSYPHCWRCSSPLIYKSVSSWFIKVKNLRKKMLHLNEALNWMPSNIKYGLFKKWLSNAKDWSISRNRYWGTPMPIWISNDKKYPRIDIYGSLKEIKNDFGKLPLDKEGNINLHRPFIDQLVRPNPDDPRNRNYLTKINANNENCNINKCPGSLMHRVDDILDVWFDSASMPYAQTHFPFEKSKFNNEIHHKKAHLVIEYIGQTRGWFYTLHVLSTALFNQSAFSNVISHGIILGSDKQKMSKSRKNYPNILEVIHNFGSDTLRWFLVSSPVTNGLNISIKNNALLNSAKQIIFPLLNAWNFLVLYSNSARKNNGYKPNKIFIKNLIRNNKINNLNILDKYLLQITNNLIKKITLCFQKYEIINACKYLREYSNSLNNWYIRCSRYRFFDEDIYAFEILAFSLEIFCKLISSFIPIISEEIWRGLTGKESIHLSKWPVPFNFKIHKQNLLNDNMNKIKEICSLALSIRKLLGIKVRIPLQKIIIALKKTIITDEYLKIIKREINVKDVDFINIDTIDFEDFGIEKKLIINPKIAGPRFGKKVQNLIKMAKLNKWKMVYYCKANNNKHLHIEDMCLKKDEYVFENIINKKSDSSYFYNILTKESGEFIALKTTLNKTLLSEGIARDIIRKIQILRKSKRFHVSDRIKTIIYYNKKSTIRSLSKYCNLIKEETLSVNLNFIKLDSSLFKEDYIKIYQTM